MCECFKSKWNLWVHPNNSTNWTKEGYHHIMTIQNAKDAWEILNNFSTLKCSEYQFFLMRDNIFPMWEDDANITGGTSIIRVRMDDKNLFNLWTDICLLLMNEQLCDPNNDINGLSFNMKNELTAIKIWNGTPTPTNDRINKNLISKYKLKGTITYYLSKSNNVFSPK